MVCWLPLCALIADMYSLGISSGWGRSRSCPQGHSLRPVQWWLLSLPLYPSFLTHTHTDVHCTCFVIFVYIEEKAVIVLKTCYIFIVFLRALLKIKSSLDLVLNFCLLQLLFFSFSYIFSYLVSCCCHVKTVFYSFSHREDEFLRFLQGAGISTFFSNLWIHFFFAVSQKSCIPLHPPLFKVFAVKLPHFGWRTWQEEWKEKNERLQGQ